MSGIVVRWGGGWQAACAAAMLLLAGCAAGAAARKPAGEDALRPGAAPLEVAKAFYAALHAGDAQRAGALVASPNGARVAAAFIEMAGAYRQLEEALRARYGEEASQAVGYRQRTEVENEAIARATASVTGDEAVITVGDQTLAMLRRVEGAWRISLDEALTSDAGAGAIAREAAATRTAAERVAPAIRHGLFASADDAIEAFRNEMTKQLGGGEEDVPPEREGDGEGQPAVTL